MYQDACVVEGDMVGLIKRIAADGDVAGIADKDTMGPVSEIVPAAVGADEVVGESGGVGGGGQQLDSREVSGDSAVCDGGIGFRAEEDTVFAEVLHGEVVEPGIGGPDGEPDIQ